VTGAGGEDELRGLERVELEWRSALDLELIGTGAYMPLRGFMTSEDYSSVLERMRLSSGEPWTLPITLAAPREEARKLREGDDIALYYAERAMGLLNLEEKYSYDKRREAELVYRTKAPEHPGVRRLYSQGELLLGGRIELITRLEHSSFREYRLEPRETRRIFEERGWRSIVGFQTRNPIHRAHEYITKCALEMVDGLFVHPLIGQTKEDDIPARIRMECYKAMIKHYYPAERVLLGIFPCAMRYAGPREAVFHALVRRNYGCTHFIVGRDHAGVKGFYDPFDAQRLFSEFEPGELGITPLFFDQVFYCRRCGHMASPKTCPHSKAERLSLSGSRMRELLENSEPLPPEISRPEISEILMARERGDAR